MIAHPDMLIWPARQAGIAVPPDVDNFDADKYPHWNVFLTVQLGQPMPSPTSHWSNAEVIASIPDNRIKEVTLIELLESGLQVGHSIP